MSVLKKLRSTLTVFCIRKNIKNSIVVLLLTFCAVLQAQNIAELEYFFGNDPGVGNGSLVAATANTGNLTQTIAIPLTGLPSGFQKLTIRAKDDANVWSLYSRKTFYISEPVSSDPIVNLSDAEYWFGPDPGNGIGTPIAISGTPSETIENFVIPLGALDEGFHTISIRIKNLDNVWSLYNRKAFYIIGDDINNTPSNLQAIEYWFDDDPGNGNGTAIALSGTPSETIESFAIPLGDLDGGFHKLSIRVKNQDDTWSLYNRKTFYIINPETNAPASPLTDAEFLYDAELGFGTGTSVAITPTGNPNEYLVEVPTDMVDCGLHDVSLSVKNALGNYSLYSITVDTDVFDNVPPTIVVLPNIIVELDENGQAPPFTITDVDNGTFDDCELVSVVLNQAQFDYTCADLGANTVTVTATDAENKVSTLDVTVTVEDNINPVAIAQNITVQLDANGNATTTADAINNNSTDNCAIASSSIDITNFTCADLGANTVVLTVTDQSGNENTTTATVTVEDNINPVAIAEDITMQLDANGNATTTADAINNNSTDNCAIASSSIDVTNFTCADLGANTVVLTVTDQSGNENTTTATVTVEDNINPVAIAQDITVQLDANGNAITTADAINNNSTDNCTITSSSLDITNFTCADLGVNTVVLTVTDQSGNENTTTATVTVEDNINPVVLGQDITVDLEGNASVSITANDVDNGSSDNCGVVTLSIDVDTFTETGMYPVILTVTDGFGNTQNVTVIVTVTDDTLSSDEFKPEEFKVFPNPTSDNLYINFEQQGNYSLSIYDVSGKEIIRKEKLELNNTINFSKYDSGVYILSILDRNKKGVRNIKIVKD